ncbi:MAG: hypothetical protein ACPF8V_08785 [Luteibaculum sp.]
MNKLKLGALLVAGAVAFTSCKEDEKKEDNNSNNTPSVTAGACEFFPIATGNLWIYEDGEGAIDTVRIGSSDTINGNTWFEVIDNDETGMIYCGPDFLYSWDESADPFSGEANIAGSQRVVQKNPSVGQTWTDEFELNGNVTAVAKFTVKGVNITMDVKGTTYTDVIEIELESYARFNGQTGPSAFSTRWLSQGIGLIKYSFQDSTSNVVEELIDFEFN